MFKGKRFDCKEYVEGDLVSIDTVEGKECIIIPKDSGVTSVDDYMHHNNGTNPLSFHKWYTVIPESLQKLSGDMWCKYDHINDSISQLM